MQTTHDEWIPWKWAKPKNLGKVVVRPAFSPQTVLSYTAHEISIKTPSEHSINGVHYPVEMQIKHTLDVDHSLIYPHNAYNKKI